MKESQQAARQRWQRLSIVQKEYSEFRPFLEDGMRLLGFSVSDMQADIGNFITYGPRYLMVQAQREEAKTTIAGLFSVWSLLQNPTLRVFIVSAGEGQANQISKLITQIIMTWDILDMMRPDSSAGDRTSVENFDLHHSLKGIDKSPSVSCVGIFGNFTGYRADLLIADDVESPKNSETPRMREKLLERTREFTSICGTGRILYLGTPQNNESIYNTLPARGYTVRIWPGRFPTTEQLPTYGDLLAPYVTNKLLMNPSLGSGGGLLGDQGMPTDPLLKDEHILQTKELSEGSPYFQLQFMLNTALADKQRYPLKSTNLVYMNLALNKQDPSKDLYPMTVLRDPRGVHQDCASAGYTFKMGQALPPSVADYRPLQSKIMFIDPAGGGVNGDETGYAVLGFLNGNCFLIEIGGVRGGHDVSTLERLSDIAARHKPEKVLVEKNFGFGTWTAIFMPFLKAKHACAIEDIMVSKQKEKRIIDVLEPVISRGSLVVLESAIRSNEADALHHEPAKRKSYDMFHQMNHISHIKDCLEHDDRLDALAGAVEHYSALMSIDQKRRIEEEEKAKVIAQHADPFGRKAWAAVNKQSPRRGHSLLHKYRK